ncbi:MAG: 1-acyl-sn-glycerol-3-phosphate acyltransferase [Dehalococcoidales bacterium]|nr:1-acyl-sn-glycerol-3-phosphate acyltransferase [Dehalococcoidales bacterium]
MHWVYYFGRIAIRVAVFPFAGWEIKGRENVPREKPVLIIANHLHLADPPVLAASIPVKCVFMAKQELWQHWWPRFWVENFGAFPIRRGMNDIRAFRIAERWLGEGFSLVIFPEGARSNTGALKKARPGAALIAMRLGIPVLPVGISGTEKLNHLGRCLIRRPCITVNIGRPFHPPPYRTRPTRNELEEFTEEMMRRIASLLPPQYRGVYDDDATGN